MTDLADHEGEPGRLSFLPPARWLTKYRIAWLPQDAIAGVTLAAYAIPVSLAYATLGRPAAAGRHLWLSARRPRLRAARLVAPTGDRADVRHLADDRRHGRPAWRKATRNATRRSRASRPSRWPALCLLAWALRLSVLVKLISDSILVGFKAGAGLTIAMTQLPSLFGVAGGGHNFFERAWLFAGQLGQRNFSCLLSALPRSCCSCLASGCLPGRPVALGVVALSIVVATVFGLPALGVPVTGEIPSGLPSLAGPALRLRDVEGILPLAAGCLLLAYIEGVSAARTFAAEARLCARPTPGVSRPRRRQPRGRARPRLSGRRRAVAVGRERQGGRAHAARARLRLGHPGAVPALPHRAPGKLAEGGARSRGADRGGRADRCPGADAHVAGEPASISSPPRSRSSRCCCSASSTAS